MAYVNSWNMSLVEINGVDFTNVWSNNMPAAIDGKWYIHYVGTYSWSHFEAPALKDADELSGPIGDVEIYPNPFSSEINIMLNGLKDIQKVELFNSIGQIVEMIDRSQIDSDRIKLEITNPGAIFVLKVSTKEGVIIRTLVRNR